MKHKYLKNVVTLKFMGEKCIGCGKCAEVCPHRVFNIADRKAQIKDKNACMECGACAMNCPCKCYLCRSERWVRRRHHQGLVYRKRTELRLFGQRRLLLKYS